MKNVYIAGPMRGYPEFNFPAFFAAAKVFRDQKYTVFNPAERDNDKYGADISKDNDTGSEEQAAKEHGFCLREALGADMAWICKYANMIAMLPGWEGSKGAIAEHATAQALNLEIVYLEKAND